MPKGRREPQYYDRTCQPIPEETFRRLFSSRSYRNVEYTRLTPDIEVITIWTGIDYSYGERRPLIFETTVYGAETVARSYRSSSEPEARMVHKRAVERLSKSGR